MTLIIVGIILIFVIFLSFIQNSIDEKKKKEEERRRQEQLRIQSEQKRIADLQAKKIADEIKAENKRLKKIEDEKYETFSVVNTCVNANGEHQAYYKRQDNTYALVITTYALIEDSNLRHFKEITNEWNWVSLQEIEDDSQLRIVEVNSPYALNLERFFVSNPSNFNFNTIRNISVSIMNQLTEEVQKKLHRELNKGVAILMTENHLHSYQFAFGKMHQAKLQEAFQFCHILSYIDLQFKEIEVIDYGCGQGMGTVVFIDFLKSNNIVCSIQKVKLIEPSTLALKRAALNVRYSLRSNNQDENVFAINKRIDDINEIHLKTTDNSLKIHILSNIIDVEGFDLNRLCRKISSTQKGKNYFFCISPKFSSDGFNVKNLRLDNFLLHFQQNHQTTIITQRETDITNPSSNGKPHTRYERVFSVNIPTAKNDNFNLQTTQHINIDDLPF